MKLLDHGSLTQIDHMGTEVSIIEAARMSTSGSFVSWWAYEGHPKGDAGLLEYLYKNRHFSPFEMCELVVEVEAPIFVAREWMRHRTFSFNEFSARYSVMPDVHYVPQLARIEKQKKGAGPVSHLSAMDFCGRARDEQTKVYETYQWATDYEGISREIARLNTPVSRYTKFRVKGNLRNWLQFLDLRLRENAQFEIRVYAGAVADIVSELWPRTYALFEKYTLHATTITIEEAEEYRLLKGMEACRKLTRLSEEMGLYEMEKDEET